MATAASARTALKAKLETDNPLFLAYIGEIGDRIAAGEVTVPVVFDQHISDSKETITKTQAEWLLNAHGFLASSSFNKKDIRVTVSPL